MKWQNLKQNKCPKCSKKLTWKEPSTGAKKIILCEDTLKNKCDFRISQDAMNRVIGNMQKPKKYVPNFRSEEENLSALNNLGREENSRSFLD